MLESDLMDAMQWWGRAKLKNRDGSYTLKLVPFEMMTTSVANGGWGLTLPGQFPQIGRKIYKRVPKSVQYPLFVLRGLPIKMSEDYLVSKAADIPAMEPFLQAYDPRKLALTSYVKDLDGRARSIGVSMTNRMVHSALTAPAMGVARRTLPHVILLRTFHDVKDWKRALVRIVVHGREEELPNYVVPSFPKKSLLGDVRMTSEFLLGHHSGLTLRQKLEVCFGFEFQPTINFVIRYCGKNLAVSLMASGVEFDKGLEAYIDPELASIFRQYLIASVLNSFRREMDAGHIPMRRLALHDLQLAVASGERMLSKMLPRSLLRLVAF
jgi:hypothetical protein